MRTAIFATALVLAAFGNSPGKAQGIDCRYPSSPPLTIAELTVCQNPSIYGLEERLTRRYFRIRGELRGRELYQFDQDQERWRFSRQQCGYNTQCLYNVYERRLGELREIREDLREDNDRRDYRQDPPRDNRPDPRDYIPDLRDFLRR